MLEESNARVNTAEKGGKGLRVLGKGERIRFYLDGLDRRFEVEPIVIEGLNHAVNFGIEFFRQQEVSISCTEKEVKLVTGSKGQERLTRLCSAYGKPFPFMIKGRQPCHTVQREQDGCFIIAWTSTINHTSYFSRRGINHL